MNCSQCKHWGGEKMEDDGTCRGAPPVPLLTPSSQRIIPGGTAMEYKVNSYFPMTRGTTPACGAFELKEATA